jgi:ribonuclease P protein component
MLAKKERLTRKEFDLHFKQGRRFHADVFQLIVSPSPTFHGAVVVGKKVYPHAVDRNRVRRSLYPILAQFGKGKRVSNTLIVITKPALVKLTGTQAREALRGLLSTAVKTT